MSSSTTLIERIEFQAVAPRRPMPGLDDAQRKLEALGVALTAINSRLASVTTMSAFRRTTKGIEDSIKQLESRRGKGLNLKQVAANLGLPSDDLRQYILRVQEQITQDITAHERKRKKLKGAAGMRGELLKEQRAMEAALKSVRDTFVGPTMRVRSAPAAARMIAAYQKQALNEVRDFSHAQAATLQTLLGGGTVGALPNIADVASAIEKQAAGKRGAGSAERGTKKKNEGTVSGAPAGAS